MKRRIEMGRRNHNEVDHKGMVDYCREMQPQDLSHVLNNHYSEFVNSYRAVSKSVDEGKATVKFEVEDDKLVAVIQADNECIDTISENLHKNNYSTDTKRINDYTRINIS
jgi:hypothetical protein